MFRPDPDRSIDRLVVDSFNSEVLETATAAATTGVGVAIPLVVRGAAGTGKTHTLHAIAGIAQRERPGADVVVESAAVLVRRLSDPSDAEALTAIRSADLVVIDDADAVRGNEAGQHTLVQLAAENPDAMWMVAVRRQEDAEPLLRDWMAAGSAVSIGTPDRPALERVVRNEAERLGLRPEEDAVAGWIEDAGGVIGACVQRVREHAASVRPDDEFGSFLTDITSTVADMVDAAPWKTRIGQAILRWEGEGFRTRRLEAALEKDEPGDVDALLEQYESDVRRLREIADRYRILDPEGMPGALFRDPDRVRDAAALLASREHASSEPAPEPDAGTGSDRADRWLRESDRILWSWVAPDRVIEELG